MTRRARSIPVAFVGVESREMRHFRLAWTQVGDVDEWLADKRQRVGPYYCGACFADRGLKHADHAPIYPRSDVPEDAECDVCHIGIRELQAMMARDAAAGT